MTFAFPFLDAGCLQPPRRVRGGRQAAADRAGSDGAAGIPDCGKGFFYPGFARIWFLLFNDFEPLDFPFS